MTTAAQRRSLRKPGKLHRVLTSYVATKVTVDHPASPKVETPCRWGTMVGFALVDEQFGYGSGGARELTGYHVNLPADPVSGGYYSDGDTPVSFQQNEWVAPVYNAGTAAADGALVYYYDVAQGPVGDVTYHLVVGATSGTKTAFAGVLKESMTATTAADVVILLTPNPAASLT